MLEKGRPRGLFLSDRFCGRPPIEDPAFGFIEPLPSPAKGDRVLLLVRAVSSMSVCAVRRSSTISLISVSPCCHQAASMNKKEDDLWQSERRRFLRGWISS